MQVGFRRQTSQLVLFFSGTQGGDTKEAALLIFPYRFSDLSHNYNEQEITLQMFELPDEILPTVLSASLNLENGVFEEQAVLKILD